MPTWTRSAGIVLAWTLMVLLMVTGGRIGPAHPAQASTRTATITTANTSTASTSTASTSTQASLTTQLTPAATATTSARTATYAVSPGDTLSGIAARFAVPGGWQALYAANQEAIGPDPGIIRPGTVLVLPARTTPLRYTIEPGDTLSAIATRFAVPGGWPALYTANKPAIGPDPGAIRPGTVLTITTPAPARARPVRPAPSPAPPPGAAHQPLPAPTPTSAPAPAAAGMPHWLKTTLLAVGLLALAMFLAEPVLLARRRRRQQQRRQQQQQQAARTPWLTPPGCSQRPSSPQLGLRKTRIVLADHDRLVVTRNKHDGMVYVLRPPGEDPNAILRVARLVLPEGSYGELADQLGVTAGWRKE
jgi:LysM repeat protein